MSSQAQIDANRLNAQKSTGPRTPEGRAAVRLNGVTHGLTAKTLVLKDESESDFHAIFDSLEAEHQPSTPTEEMLVSQLAMACWRLRRLYHTESSFLRISALDQKLIFDNYTNLTPSGRLAIVVDRDPVGNNTLTRLCRFEARLERSFYRALHELQRLRAQRPVEVEEPSEKQVEKPKSGLVCKIEPQVPAVPSVPPQKTQPQPPQSPISEAHDIIITNAT